MKTNLIKNANYGKAIAKRLTNSGSLSENTDLLEESLYSVIETQLELSDKQRDAVVSTHLALKKCLPSLYIEKLPNEWDLDDVGFTSGKQMYLMGIETLFSCYLTSHRMDDSTPEERRKIYKFYHSLKDLICHLHLVFRNLNDLEPAA